MQGKPFHIRLQSRPIELRSCTIVFRHHQRLPASLHHRNSYQRWSVQAATANEAYQQALSLPFQGVIDTALSVSIVGALIWSALPVIASSTESRRAEWEDKVWDNQDGEGVKWGLMSVISFLPVFNWLAWVFGGLQNEERSAFYFTLAALYAAPQLENGFQQNFFSLATLAAGIAHIQIERIAEERGVLRDSFQVSQDVKEKPKQVGQLLEGSAKNFAEAVDTRERNEDIKQEVLRGKTPKTRDQNDSADQLSSWDKRFKDRDR